jgi:hypothetical protein
MYLKFIFLKFNKMSGTAIQNGYFAFIMDIFLSFVAIES